MKITLDIPDTTRCLFINGAMVTNEGCKMAVTQVETAELFDGAEVVCDWGKVRYENLEGAKGE